MLKAFTLILALAVAASTYCQPISFVIEGHIDRATSSKTVMLEWGQKKISAPIQKDGRFRIAGTMEKPDEVLLKTDKAFSTLLWLEGGTVHVRLQESRISPGDKRFMLRIKDLQGPADTYLYYYNQFLTKNLAGTRPGELDSLIANAVTHMLDSVLAVRPSSSVLPYYLDFYARTLGAPVVSRYYHLFSKEQQFSQRGIWTASYLAQQAALAKDSVFQDFSIPDSAGNLISLHNIAADYILVDFWASWCGPCRANHPYLKKAYDTYKNKGFSIISISLDDDRQDWLNAVKKDGITWLNACDLKEYEGELAKRCQLYAVPYSLLLDKDRRIIAFNLTGNELVDRLRTIFGGIAPL